MDEPKILDEARSARCFCPYIFSINGDPAFSFQTEPRTAAAQSGEGGGGDPRRTLPVVASRECGSCLRGSGNLESPLHCFAEIRSIKIDP